MARVLHAIEKGLRIYAENSQSVFVDHLFGAGSPPGTSGETAEAPIGSIYSNSTNGGLWKKITNTNSASDWSEMGDVTIDELHWRNELVRAATNDTVSAGTVDPTSFSDNESGLDGNDFAVGEHLLGDVNGVPALFRVTVVTGPTDITVVAATTPIANGDTFVVQSYLPDAGAAQEAQAILHIPAAGSPGIKIGDFNWAIATGINLSGAYAATSGNVAANDTLEAAIAKLDGVNDNQDTALGLAQGATHFGTFTGGSLADNQTAKQLFQRLEVLLEQMRGVQATGITAAVTVDSVPHASVKAAKWLVEAFEEATPANRQAVEVYALNDGTNVDNTVYSKLKLGANFNLTISVDISGADMRLRAASSTAGVTVTARRIEVVKSVL
jgi:hypothetical protein